MKIQRNWQIWISLWILWGCFLLTPVFAQNQSPISIKQVNYQAGMVSLLSSQQLAPQIQYLNQSSPQKVVIDLPDTIYHPVRSEFSPQDQNIQKIRVSQFSNNPPSVRLVIDHTSDLNVSIRSVKTDQGFLTQIQPQTLEAPNSQPSHSQVSPPPLNLAVLPDYQLTKLGLRGDNLYLEGTGPVVPQIRRANSDSQAYILTLYDYKSALKGPQNLNSKYFENLDVMSSSEKTEIRFRLTQNNIEIVPYSTGNTCIIQFLPMAASKNQAHLKNVQVAEINANVTRVRIPSSREFDFQIYPLEGPHRLVIDTQGTVKDKLSPQSVDIGQVKQARYIAVHPEKQADLRIVLDLTGEVRYQYQYDAAKGYLEILLQASQSQRPTFKKGRAFIVIDAGHGGNDPGAIGTRSTREKDVTLAVSNYLKRYLENDRLDVVMTRDSDLEVLLQPRVDVANLRDADLFISIHANSMPPNNQHVNGIETYYTTDQSLALAETLQRYLVKELGAKDRSVRKRGLYVTRKTNMPSVLLEIGFLSSPEEEAKLADPNYQRLIAKAIRDGIYDYLSKHPPRPKPGT